MSTDRNEGAAAPGAGPADGPCQSCCCHCAQLGCLSCEVGPQALADLLENRIAEAGFAVVFIYNHDPPFAYSLGMTETYGLPEFAVVGHFSPDIIGSMCAGVDHLARATPDVLRTAARELEGFAECRGADGAPVATAFGYAPIAPENLTYEAALPMTQTINRYGLGGFAMRQIVVPDPGRKLPWHEGHDSAWSLDAGQRALYVP